MKGYELSTEAARDIVAIWCRIARDSYSAADEVEAAIYENCELLAISPNIGHKPRYHTRRKALVWPASPYKNYLIVYHVLATHIEIVRILNGGRQRVWKAL